MKIFFIRFCLVIFLLPSISYAQALPSSVQKSVSGLIQQKMSSRGFAANDPRFGLTLQSAGTGIAGAAAAAAVVTAAGVTAPAWITAAATVALGSLFAVGIDLAIDKTVHWLMNKDGTVSVGTSSQSGTQTTIAINGDRTITNIIANSTNKPFISISSSPPFYYTQTWYSTTAFTNPATGVYTLNQTYSLGGTLYYIWTTAVTQSSTPCPGNYTLNGTVCVANKATSSAITVTQALNNLSPADLAKSVNPDVIAQISDSAWKNAASQPGYDGYPYDAANPITAADASAFQLANPDVWPKVSDIVSPQPAPPGGKASDPFTLTNSGSGGTSPPNQTNSTFDWSIPARTETVPQVQVPVSYTPTIFASPTGCPAPIQFSMFSTTYFISYQPACDLMTTLAPIFLACGAAAAALIFMESLKS